MTHDEFVTWILKYCPADREPEEFVDRLAIGSIALVEKAAENTGLSIDELVANFVWSDDSSATN